MIAIKHNGKNKKTNFSEIPQILFASCAGFTSWHKESKNKTVKTNRVAKLRNFESTSLTFPEVFSSKEARLKCFSARQVIIPAKQKNRNTRFTRTASESGTAICRIS